jgi:hypothetical protein
MTFDIRLAATGDTGDPKESEGVICVEGTREMFVASHDVWTRDQYTRQWVEAAGRLLEGSRACFVTDVAADGTEYLGERWNAWPEGDGVALQHQLLVGPDSGFNVDEPYASVPPVAMAVTSGVRPSTWRVPLKEIADWRRVQFGWA